MVFSGCEFADATGRRIFFLDASTRAARRRATRVLDQRELMPGRLRGLPHLRPARATPPTRPAPGGRLGGLPATRTPGPGQLLCSQSEPEEVRKRRRDPPLSTRASGLQRPRAGDSFGRREIRSNCARNTPASSTRSGVCATCAARSDRQRGACARSGSLPAGQRVAHGPLVTMRE